MGLSMPRLGRPAAVVARVAAEDLGPTAQLPIARTTKETVRPYDPSLPLQAATRHLKELLEAASWHSGDEALRHEVASMVPEMKLTLFTNLGAVLTLAAFVTCWITGEDPLGGFAMTDSSLDATLAGAGYSLPLAACSVLSRLRPVRRGFPVLDDLHDTQQEVVRPIVHDLTPAQLLILASVVVAPCMLLLLPAFHGTMAVAGQIVAQDVMQPLGLEWAGVGWLHAPAALRRSMGVLLPAVGSAYFAAWIVTKQVDVNDHQVWAIRDAIGNADRYFLHTAAERVAERPDILTTPLQPQQSQQQQSQQQQQSAAGPRKQQPQQQQPQQQQQQASSMGGGPVTSFASMGDAATDAAAWGSGGVAAVSPSGPLRQLGADMSQSFKTVSILWLLTRRRAARLAYVLTAMNVAYFGVIWHQTHDLATPVTAALLAALTELFLVKYTTRGGRSVRAGNGGAGTGSNGGSSE